MRGRWWRTALLVLAIAAVVGVAGSSFMTHGTGSCVDGVDLRTGQGFGYCTYPWWDRTTAIVLFVLAAVVLGPPAFLLRYVRTRRVPADDRDIS